MAKTNFLLNLLTGALETVGESQLEALLQDLHDSDMEGYKAAIYGLHRGVALLLPFVTKSKSKIDDAILNGIDQAVTTSAKDNGIDLAVALK